jgi:hypothetical protein
MPPLKETRLQIQERNRREIRQRTNKRIAELAQETESKRQGSRSQQEDELEDKIEDKIEAVTQERNERVRQRADMKIEGSRLCRVCQFLVWGVLFVIMSVFALSVVWHVGSKRAA